MDEGYLKFVLSNLSEILFRIFFKSWRAHGCCFYFMFLDCLFISIRHWECIIGCVMVDCLADLSSLFEFDNDIACVIWLWFSVSQLSSLNQISIFFYGDCISQWVLKLVGGLCMFICVKKIKIYCCWFLSIFPVAILV